MTECPCCKQPLEAPSLPEAIAAYGLAGHDAAVLEAVWSGRGLTVPTVKIFDAMYADDPDGGPSPTQMYRAFKVALCRLRARLEGSGISIEPVGFRLGYRLSLR